MSSPTEPKVGGDDAGSEKADYIRRFHAEGLVLVRLHALGDILPNGSRATGKEPVARAWQKTTASPPLEECLTWSNYGILPGPSKRAVLDVEPAGLDSFPRERLREGALVVSTPSGGYHVHLDLEVAERVLGKLNKKVKLGVKAELHSFGSQVLGPGSRAYSEKAKREGDYAIEQDGAPISDESGLRILLAPFLESNNKNGRASKQSRCRTTGVPEQEAQAWAMAALTRELAAVAGAPAGVGSAHNTMMSSGARLGQIVGAGHLDRDSVVEQLIAAALDAGWEEKEARRCATAAVEFGMKNPRGPADLPDIEIASENAEDGGAPGSAPNPEQDQTSDGPESWEIKGLDDALALLDLAVELGDLDLLFKNARALAALSVADEAVFLNHAKEVFGKKLAKTDLKLAIDDQRRLLAKEAKRKAAQDEKLRRAARRVRVENAIKQAASTSSRKEIKLFDEAGIARDPKEIHDEAVAALVAGNAPARLFVQGGNPTRVGKDEEDQPRIVQLEEKEIQSELIHCAIFIGKNRNSDPQPVDPPPPTVRTLLGSDNLPFPRLAGLVRSPVFRRDGSILHFPGYDKTTGLYHCAESGLVVPPVSDAPSADEVRDARALVLEIFAQFPFEDEASRANAVALLFTSFLQPIVDDHRPIAVATARAAGSGKGLLVESCGRVLMGRPPRITRLTKEEELEKKIAHLLAVGTRFIQVDNAKRRLESETLESVLTSRRFSDRTFGHNDRGFDVPQDATWAVTGNNLELGTEIARRSYLIELNARVPHPEDRQGPRPGEVFKPLPQWTASNRGQLIWAVLTLGRAWWVAGHPLAKLPAFGNFERWQEVVGGVLEVAGIQDFLANRSRLRAEQDQEGLQWAAFLRAIRGVMGSAEFTAKSLALGCDKFPSIADTLPDELASMLGKDDFVQRLGQRLRSKMESRFGKDGLRIVRVEDESHDKVAQWRVVVGEEATNEAS